MPTSLCPPLVLGSIGPTIGVNLRTIEDSDSVVVTRPDLG